MKKNDKAMEVAVFRFGVISEFVTGVRLNRGEKEELLKSKVSKSYNIPHSNSSSISRSTIKKWIRDYTQAGCRIESLQPCSRKDRGTFRSLDESIQVAIKEIMNDKPDLTGVALVSELRHRKYIGLEEKLNLTVLYKFLKQNKLQRTPQSLDRRSFEAEYPNELWQSDVLHGPFVVGPQRRRQKSYLIAILDDHSRLIPHAEFYSSEKLDDFKNCLMNGVQKRGLPQKLYVDNGACYKAVNLEQICALLGVQLRHSRPYTPQGRGKVERWFRYVRENFLALCPKDMELDSLNHRFSEWLEQYHDRIHSITKETPKKRYCKNMKCVRPAPPRLFDYFRLIEFRRVGADRTFRLNGTLFEAPVGLVGQRVELRFHKSSPDEVEIFFDSNSFGLATILDRHVNFKIGRNNRITVTENPEKIQSGELFGRKEQ